MMIYDIIKAIYKKEPMQIGEEVDLGLCIALVNILRLDKDNTQSLKKIVPLLYYLEPRNFLILLFLSIPYKKYAPFLRKVEKQEEKEDRLYDKIKDTLEWSEKELDFHRHLLDNIIDREYWGNQLGVKL